MNMYMDVEASACLYIDIDWPLWKRRGTVDSIDGFIEINLSECYC